MRIDLADAAWFGRERAVGYAKMLALAFLPSLIWFYLQAMEPVGSDFQCFWGASKLLIGGSPADAYKPAAESAVQFALGRDHWFPFVNPPPFLLVIFPLGALPYGLALPLWVVTTYALWLGISRKLLPDGVWPIAVYPGALVAAWHAQNGFLTASLLVGGILTLRKRPYLAGALFGALIIKPHLALLVPVALVAGRQWRAIVAAAASAAGLLLLSWLLFGAATFSAFIASTSISSTYMTLPGDDFYLRMPTVFAMGKVLAGAATGGVAQAISSLLMAALVWWAWARPGDYLGKGAVLATATVLATPYLFSYDLPLLILPTCWMATEGLRTGFRRWERVMLVVFYWAPLVGRALAFPLHFNLTAPLLMAFLWSAWPRLKAANARPAIADGGAEAVA